MFIKHQGSAFFKYSCGAMDWELRRKSTAVSIIIIAYYSRLIIKNVLKQYTTVLCVMYTWIIFVVRRRSLAPAFVLVR
jgi:hypothetical protein